MTTAWLAGEPFAAWIREALVALRALPPLRQDLHLTGHGGDVTHAAFSPDGQRVVTASCDLTARVWDTRTGAEELVLTGHERFCLNGASFSPDGRWIVTAGGDHTARVWDAATGEQVRLLAGHADEVNSAEFSPDGTRIATAGGGPGALEFAARLWDATTGEELAILNGHTRPVLGASFSPDGLSLLTWAPADSVRLWDAQTGQQRHQFDSGFAAFSSDGQRIVVVGDQDGVAHVYETAGGRQVFTLSPGDQLPKISTATLSPDGRLLLTASRGESIARVWDVASGAAWGQLTGHTGDLSGIRFSPDGRFILTYSVDRTAALWDASSGQRLRQFVGHTNHVTDAVFSPDMRFVLTYSVDDTAWLWDIADLDTP
jgi:WD40 repeat protein